MSNIKKLIAKVMLTKEEKKEVRFLKRYFKDFGTPNIPLTPGLQIRHFHRADRLKFLLNKTIVRN